MIQPPNTIHQFYVDSYFHGQRLDLYLCSQTTLSRKLVQTLISQGHTLYNNKPLCKNSYKVRTQDHIVLTVPPLQHKSSLEAVAMPLDIVYEDPHLMILNKPPNISVHPAPSIKEATLVNGLLDYCQNNLSSINDDTRPGIVHRIDKNTSGLIVIAKHNRAHKHLAYQFETHGVYRRYVALVWGYPPINNTIDAPLKRDPYNRLKISVQKNGSRAITHTHVLNYLKPLQCTLLECRLETGRTHQIRVHLSHKGYPLMGDPIYGKNLHSKINTLPMHAQKALQNFSRQALHAQDLGFIHPITAKPLMFSSPLPLDFKNLYQALHNSIL